MTDRERLIKILSEPISPREMVDPIVAVADYLLDEGVIAPPLKVGDVVYSWYHSWKKDDGIVPYQITNLTITQNKKGIWTKKYRAMWLVDGKTRDWSVDFSFEEIGVTVFLTSKEAVAALKGDNND